MRKEWDLKVMDMFFLCEGLKRCFGEPRAVRKASHEGSSCRARYMRNHRAAGESKRVRMLSQNGAEASSLRLGRQSG